MDYTLEHLRVAQLDLPGEMLDSLVDPKAPAPPALAEDGLFFAPGNRPEQSYFIETSAFLGSVKKAGFPKRLATLIPFVQQASDHNYDYLLCRFL